MDSGSYSRKTIYIDESGDNMTLKAYAISEDRLNDAVNTLIGELYVNDTVNVIDDFDQV